MFCSLQKIDAVLMEGPDAVAIQTDHRDAADVEEDWALSVIFAAARARNPLLSGNATKVRFVLMGEASPRFVRFLTLLGAEVETQPGGVRHAPAPDPAAVDAEVRAAVAELAAEIFQVYDAQPDAAGLALVEQAILEDRGHARPDDETRIEFWTAVVGLGAATVATVQALHGGELVASEALAGMVPYRLRVGDTLLAVFGRAEEFLDRDPTWRPSTLLALLADQAAPDGDVMYSFHARDWAAAPHALLLPFLPEAGVDAPLLTLVVDLPNTTKTVPPTEDSAPLRAQAAANLRRVVVTRQAFALGAQRGLSFLGHYYAGEKLLDAEFLRAQAEELGAELLMAAVPCRGLLLLAPAVADVRFHALVREQYQEAAPGDRISSVAMLVRDGEVVGVARATPVEPGLRGGFWRRLVGRQGAGSNDP